MSPSVCSAAFVTVGGAHPVVTVVLVVDGTVVGEVVPRVVAVVDVDGAGDSSVVVTEVVVEEGGASLSGEVAATTVFEPSVR